MTKPFIRLVLSGVLSALAAPSGQPLFAQADHYGPDATARTPKSKDPRHFVVVSKSHFDIGYSALARDVEHEYRTTMIDRALETMEQNAKLAGPGEQFVWTIPGWPMQTILWDGQNPARQQRLEEALKRGNLVMHALPYTIETASADVETLVRSFIYSSRIARRYGLPLPGDAQMTDVPGHDWIIPPLLHQAGVKFFHLGANPTNIQIKKPRLFWWEGPDGSRVLTMYSSGYDSGLLPPTDWPHKTWLAMVMGGDNEGPPSAATVRGWIGMIKKQFPNAKITVGRVEDFADALLAEKPDLPVVRGNVSDSWIHGLASSPNAMKTLAIKDPQFRLRTPGALTDPAKDMIEGGNFAFFWTQGGVSVCDPAGRGVGLCSPDAPALSLGEPGIYKFKGQWPWPHPKSSIYVHLFNNKWNTNFRSFWNGEFSARVRLWPITTFEPEKDLITPSEETLSPMRTGLSNYQPGQLPPVAKGVELSRKGVTVTAFGPNPDGAGTLLRLWELAGTSGDCAVTLPEPMKTISVQPIDLRGRPVGHAIPVKDRAFTVALGTFAPVSFLIQP